MQNISKDDLLCQRLLLCKSLCSELGLVRITGHLRVFCLVRRFCFGFKTDQYVSTAFFLIPGLDYNSFIFGHKPKYGHPGNMAGILKIYMSIVMQLSAQTSTFALLSMELNVRIRS